MLCYRPERLFLIVFMLCLLDGVLLALYPAEFYWHHRRVEEWMIYRFLTCFLLGSAGFLLLCATALSHRMSALGPKRRDGDSFWIGVVARLFEWQPLLAFSGGAVVASVALLWPGIVEFVTTGGITLHWSRIIVGVFGLLLAFQALVTLVLLQVVALWVAMARYRQAERARQALEPAGAGRRSGGARLMGVTQRLHDGYVHGRRVRVLADLLAGLIPPAESVLDVGCGDGLLARCIQDLRPDIQIRGIDVMVRDGTHVPVHSFDGRTIPHGDGEVDVVLFVDVLHHTDDPMILLREAARVARKGILIKDHTRDGLLAGSTLRFMDYVGNAHHGVVLPYNYWPHRQWLDAFRDMGLTVRAWQDELKLYPLPADWVFGRSLHFIAHLEPVRPEA